MFLRKAGILLILFVQIGFSDLAQAGVQISDETVERIDALVSSKIPWTGYTPAYSILIDQAGQIVYERNIGYADIGNRVPATRDTVYKTGSITKSYTALAVLQMVEKGQIDLDARVSQYVTDLEGPAAGVTVRQLLTHTSGIPNYTALPEAEPILAWVVTSRDEIVDLFDDKPLDFEPGTHYSYSNSGYYLLGLIIEAVSDQDYFDYLKTQVFEPLHLEATYTGAYEEIVPHQARGYLVTPEGFANADPVPQLTPYSAGTLEASAADLVKYRRAVFKSEVTTEKLRELITTTGTFSGGDQQRYALGALVVSDFYGHPRWGHSGGISGFSSHHDYFPDDDLTVVVLVNANGAPVSPGALASKMAREIFSIAQPEETEVEVSGQLLESYVGKYRMSPFRLFGEFARIVLKDGVLQLQVNNDDENPTLMPLLPRSINEFVLAMDDELRLRFIAESGEVTGLELITSSGALPAYRVSASQP
jgi:CubicO group peptidase (beta-lactamase class C family)